jgi:hypothetical protein
VDDGLLIRDQKIIAGRSAKKEANYLAAVRTALFTEKEHRRQVRHVLEHTRFKRILVLGTSDRMVRKICANLQLPEPAKIISIEEIATAEEIQTAMNHRTAQGRHVIPVPAIEVKRNYPRIMADSIRVMFRRGLGLIRQDKSYEKTVVRPQFSAKGTVTISEPALTQMILHCVDEFMPGLSVKKVSFSSDHRGYQINVHVTAPFRLQLAGSVHGMQQYIVDHLERFTGIIVEELNIIIDNVKGGHYNSKEETKQGKSGGRS